MIQKSNVGGCQGGQRSKRKAHERTMYSKELKKTMKRTNTKQIWSLPYFMYPGSSNCYLRRMLGVLGQDIGWKRSRKTEVPTEARPTISTTPPHRYGDASRDTTFQSAIPPCEGMHISSSATNEPTLMQSLAMWRSECRNPTANACIAAPKLGFIESFKRFDRIRPSQADLDRPCLCNTTPIHDCCDPLPSRLRERRSAIFV